MQQKIYKMQYSGPRLHNVPYNVGYISVVGFVLILFYTQGFIWSYRSHVLFQLPIHLFHSLLLFSFCIFSPFSSLLYSISLLLLLLFYSLPCLFSLLMNFVSFCLFSSIFVHFLLFWFLSFLFFSFLSLSSLLISIHLLPFSICLFYSF